MTGKDFDLLVFFARNPGRLLEKDELMAAVWPGSFVEECNVARHVSTLRKLLDDTAKTHKYIATVQGKGYRFLADVRSEGDEALGSEEEPPLPPPPGRGSGNLWGWLLAAAIGAAILAVGLVQSGSSWLRRETIRFDDIRQIKLTQDGSVYTPVISPDGQYLAYVCPANEAGPGICVRQIGTGSVLQVVAGRRGSERWGPAIAPDNGSVYFISKDEGADHGVLYRVPFFGGAPQRLAEKIAGYSLAPDGSRLALVKRDVDAGQTSIVTVQNDGTNARTVLTCELESAFYSVGWSPDGKNILYSVRRQTAEGEIRYAAEIPAAGGGERRLRIASGAQIFGIQWLPDRSGFLAVAADEETRQRQLYFLSYPEGVMRRLTSDVAGVSYFSMTADGHSAVTARMYDNRRIWVMPGGAMGEGVAVTNDTEKHFDSVEWAAGDYLVFDEDENSSYTGRNIWRMRPDGIERRQLTFGDAGNTQPTVSPDGGSIVFVSNRSGKSQLWRMNIDGGDLLKLTELAHNVAKPRFTQDGRSIFFDAWVNGMNQVWRVSPDGSDARPVIEGVDVRASAISPEGSKIAYSYFDDVTGRVEAKVRNIGEDGLSESAGFMPETWMKWSRDGRSIYFNSAEDGAQNVWRKDMGQERPVQITHFTNERVFDCSWSPDGSRFACVRQLLTSDAVMIKF